MEGSSSAHNSTSRAPPPNNRKIKSDRKGHVQTEYDFIFMSVLSTHSPERYN